MAPRATGPQGDKAHPRGRVFPARLHKLETRRQPCCDHDGAVHGPSKHLAVSAARERRSPPGREA